MPIVGDSTILSHLKEKLVQPRFGITELCYRSPVRLFFEVNKIKLFDKEYLIYKLVKYVTTAPLRNLFEGGNGEHWNYVNEHPRNF